MTRRFLISILTASVLLCVSGPLAAQPPKGVPPTQPRPVEPGGPPRTGEVSFTVELPAAALQVSSTPIEGQPQLTMSRVTLELQEPVFPSTAPGEPVLPRVRRLVALPPHATLQSVTVENLDPVTIDGVPLVEWSQPARPGQGGPNQRDPVPPELTIIGNEIVFYSGGDGVPPTSEYLTRQRWPAEMVTAVGQLGGAAANVIQIDLAPVEWRPADAQIVFYTKQVIDVRYDLPRSQPHFNPRFADHMIANDLRTQVVNPELVPVHPLPLIQKVDAPYLIITDNITWTPDMVRGVALEGDLVAEFQKLADWKTQKGIRAKVVTVSDIVTGRFGNFAGDALDLQETIRNFLQHARAKWNTYWVLLGGTDEIIPPRVVLANAYGNAAHALLLESDEKPRMGKAHWHAATSTIRVHSGSVRRGMTIYSMRDGAQFEEVGWPSAARPGWGYATDDTYRFPSFVPTEYIVVRGPLATVEHADLYLDLEENRIPTDLYYASVDDPLYDVPGEKDWDANGNGIYGQNSHTGTVDGVSFDPDLAVGRALVRSAEEAQRWVSRTLGYEKYEQSAGFAEKLLLLGDNWGATGEPAQEIPRYERLTAGRYHLFPEGADNARAHVFFRGSILNGREWILVALQSSTYVTIPYDRNASSTSVGYFYNTDETFSEISEVSVSFLGVRIGIPVPTRFVTVFAPLGDLQGSEVFFDNFSPDSVVEHKERQATAIASSAPAITEVARAYKDWFDLPGTPDPGLELTDRRARFLLEQGHNLVSLAGHGAPDGAAGLDKFMLLSPLADESGILYADSCLTGRYTASSGSLAGYLTARSSVGVSAYIGNTAYSWIGLGADFEQAFWSELRRNPALASLHHTKARYQDWNTKLWVNYSLSLYGDPELRVWRADPLPLVVDAPESVSPGESVWVRLTTESGDPITFARVALTGRNVFEVELTDLGGFAEFRPILSPGVVKVTTTPSGFLPHEVEVRVTP